jgi:hypothetical protein
MGMGPRDENNWAVGAERSSMWKRGARQPTSLNVLGVARQHLGSLDKVTGLSGSACRWPLPETSAISRKSLMPLRSCCKTSSEKTRALAAWCMASHALHSALRSS